MTKVKLPMYLIKHHTMKTYRGQEVWLHTWHIMDVNGQFYALPTLSPLPI